MDLAGYRPTLSEVSALFGKSSRWISDLRAKGDLPGDGATLGEFVAAWTSHSIGASGVKLKPIDHAKARREVARAEREEIETAALKREKLDRPVVQLAVQGAFARVRAKLLSLPAKSAPLLAAMKSAVPIEEKLTELVHEALDELARTDVVVTGDAPSAEPGDGGSGDRLVAGVHPAAAPDGEPVVGPPPDAQPRGKRRARKVEHRPG